MNVYRQWILGSVIAVCAWPAGAQEAAVNPLSKEEVEAAAAIQPPELPPEAEVKMPAGEPSPVSPPPPGEVQGGDAAAAPAKGGRIPDEWVEGEESPMVPRVSTGTGSVTKSTSTSGQFIVHGSALQLRSEVARRCEEAAEELRLVLGDKTPWVLPVVIHLRGAEESPAEGRAVSTQITEMAHGGFHLQVTVLARPDLRLRDLKGELFRALLAERILRNQKAIVSERENLLPDWVYTGVVEASRYRQRSRPSALFSILFESGKIYGIEEIIEASPTEMDSLSRAIYDTSCCALVLALLDQGEGPERFGKFLNSLAGDAKSERDLLNQWFPAVAATPSSLNKWWALQMATMAQPTVAEPLDPNESYQAIKAALTLAYQAPLNKAPPSAQPGYKAVPDLPQVRSPRPTVSPSPSPSLSALPEPSPAVETPPAASPIPPQPAPKPEVAVAGTPAPASAPAAAKPAPAAKPKPTPTPAATAAEDATASDGGEMAEAGDAEAEGGQRSGLGKLFGFLKNRGSEGTEAMADDAAVAEPEPEPEPAPEPVVEKKVEPKPEPKVEKTAEAKETKASDEAAKDAEGDKKGFNLLRMFRGKKSDGDEEKAEEEAASEGDAALSLPAESDLIATVRWLSPTSAWLLEQGQRWDRSLSPESREVFLKFLKKKKDGEGEEEMAEDEGEDSAPAEESAAPEPKKEESPAGPVIKEIKPLFGRSNKEDASGDGEEASETMTEESASEADAEPAVASAPSGSGITPLFDRLRKSKDAEAMPEAEGEETSEEKESAPPAVETASKPAPKPTPRKSPPADLSKVVPMVNVRSPISEYAWMMNRDDRAKILDASRISLQALETRVGVLFRPTIVGYLAVLDQLKQGKTKGVDEALKALDAQMEGALRMSKEVRDHLDWYEASHSGAYSGLFDEYLNLSETIRNEVPERTDPISKYLDALDSEFSE